MPDLFGIDIASEINAAMGGGLLTVTLIKVTPGTHTPGSYTAGTNATTTSYSGKGFVEDYSDYALATTTVQAGDRKVSILGASMSVVPAVNDSVTVESATYRIVAVKRDPAGAVYECQARQR